MTIAALLQARTSSSRLPGKVLKPLLGEPMILRQIERLRRVKGIDSLTVVTSTEPSDDALAKVCEAAGVTIFRGSLNDVLDRFYRAVEHTRPTHVVRLTADCPLTDPALIDQLIRFYLDGNFDYASNCEVPSYPDGLDAEIFRFDSLETIWREARLSSEREHVTPAIRMHPEKYRVGNLKNDVDLSALRWTVDEPADFQFVEAIYDALYPKMPDFVTSDILKLLDQQPELNRINAHFVRNAGYIASLQKDNESHSKA